MFLKADISVANVISIYIYRFCCVFHVTTLNVVKLFTVSKAHNSKVHISRIAWFVFFRSTYFRRYLLLSPKTGLRHSTLPL